MSDESEATRKSARAINRWRIGSLSAFQTLLLAFVVICANYLAFHHYQRVDLSRDADYSLSPATRRYLASDALQKHPQTVQLIMAYRRSSPF
jgi:cytochrome c-type biogenesis protein CcmH/NrfG